ERYKLEMVALSSGDVGSEPATMAEQIELHSRHARFVHDVGGHYLQLTGPPRPKNRQPAADDYKAAGRILTEVAKRSADLGVPVGYHNSKDTLSEGPGGLGWGKGGRESGFGKVEAEKSTYKPSRRNPGKGVKKKPEPLLFLALKSLGRPPPAEGRDAKH